MALSYLLRHMKLDLLILHRNNMLVWGHLFIMYKRLNERASPPLTPPDRPSAWGRMTIVRSGGATRIGDAGQPSRN